MGEFSNRKHLGTENDSKVVGWIRPLYMQTFAGTDYRGEKLARAREILSKFSNSHASFDHFHIFSISISRVP